MARVFTDGGAMGLESPSSFLGQLLNFSSFSVLLWIMRTAAPAAERAIIATWGGSAGNGWVINMLTTGTVQAYYPYTTQDKVRRSSTVLALNTWVPLVITHENRGLADTDWLFFFNGIQEAGVAVATGIGTRGVLACPLTIGNNANTLNSAPPMNLGPSALWSRALVPAEAMLLSGGAHPKRVSEGLVDYFDMETETGEEGKINKIYLVQGATNPTSAFGNPPVERDPYPRRQITRKARLFAAAAGGGPVLNDHNFRRVGRGVGMGVTRGAA